MDQQGLPLQPLAHAGAVTSCYAYEGGAARNAVLAALALQLAGEQGASPVLVIDWDLAAPTLHRHFALPADESAASGAVPARAQAAHLPAYPGFQGLDHDAADDARPGLLEFFEACRARLRSTAGRGDELAERVIDAVGWQAHIERADGRRPLYLLRAGRFDASYAERAGQLDYPALFEACPALYRRFAARLAQHFGHVLVAVGAGRSAAVSVCTSLVPDRLLGLFTPAPGSIEGIEGVLRRAIDYRCTHEDEQRPLLLYPLACTADGARSDPHARWRRGDARHGLPGYQPRFEALLRASYGWSRVNLDSWFDETQLALADALSTAGPSGDRRALARHAALLAEWLAPGRFPWQSQDEIRLRAAIAQARRLGTAAGGDEIGSPPLAEHLVRLGQLCRRERRRDEARACLDEALALRVRLLGDDHPATRTARAALAALLLESGAVHDARRHYDLLVQACMRKAGPEDPETLAARSQLAQALAALGEGERALALHEQVVAGCERALGDEHLVTLDCLEDLAHSLVRQHEFERARIVYERVLEARRRQQGSAHLDALRCGQRLALLLAETGELGNARRMLESVLRAHERHDGLDAADTLSAREALAEILAAQGDLAAVRSIQESLARTRERHLGAGHPETLNMQLRLASTLGQQGEAEAARLLREQVAELRQHLRDVEDAPASGGGGGDTIEARSGARACALAPESAAAGSLPLSASAIADAVPVVQHEQAAPGEHVENGHAADNLGHKLTELQDLIDNRSPGEARALADSLRTSVLRPSAAHPLRRRGAAMIKQVYLQEGDKDALLSFTQDEVSLLEGALIEAVRDKPMTMR